MLTAVDKYCCLWSFLGCESGKIDVRRVFEQKMYCYIECSIYGSYSDASYVIAMITTFEN